MTDSQWQKEVYTEGATWTIRNVLAHFVTSERGLLKLFENIRQGGDGARMIFRSTVTTLPCKNGQKKQLHRNCWNNTKPSAQISRLDSWFI